ncbi:hypothetical protein BCR39DRAFT_557265 [Naematelia encephala]|uniref:Uncharacterized protein n=1 Tax=Naematelia encephala TaxID=71784 RepID=A0A1Y2BE83_9TREE|nr:hypothetical protein BCR39DRAFT_557265 [Naematelia encephala]
MSHTDYHPPRSGYQSTDDLTTGATTAQVMETAGESQDRLDDFTSGGFGTFSLGPLHNWIDHDKTPDETTRKRNSSNPNALSCRPTYTSKPTTASPLSSEVVNSQCQMGESSHANPSTDDNTREMSALQASEQVVKWLDTHLPQSSLYSYPDQVPETGWDEFRILLSEWRSAAQREQSSRGAIQIHRALRSRYWSSGDAPVSLMQAASLIESTVKEEEEEKRGRGRDRTVSLLQGLRSRFAQSTASLLR